MFKRHFGICTCGCQQPGLIVVKKGYRDQCNRRIKQEEKSAKVVRLVNRVEKKNSLSELKKQLDTVFSLYIRKRHADANGTVECFTSGERMFWKDAHCGHFVSRRHTATRWDEQNCQVQSVAENIYNQGNAPVFAQRLDEKYGKGTADKLIMKSRNKSNIGIFECKLLIAQYQQKVAELKNKL